ncbi:DUF3667 domain-containing protein [Flavobacterium sp. WV_118_3]|jgi:hypothetical protein|uniref:DUF3667 domain-containing protein n=1 Tax=Flavobacterium sp. WV_118_3 TaxID=3151764 RepID=UPI002CCDEE99|nr:DUF3667 domain-containing protein [Flavobacterium sp.]
MSHDKIRDHIDCLNCGKIVTEKYCPNCGQDNTESRKSFHYLFTHFVEDFTHYDNAFWKTMKYLLFRPSRLTREYLEGKRKHYVAPVKLYIFISFITFFLPGVLPEIDHDNETQREVRKAEAHKYDYNYEEADSILKVTTGRKIPTIGNYSSVKEYDSIQKTLPVAKKGSKLMEKFERRLAEINEKYTTKEIIGKFKDSFIHNLPKVLFLYLPLFAFSLWLFHNKKKWYYFEHGIFTLHYFSFLLLNTMLFLTVSWLLKLMGDNGFLTFLEFLLTCIYLGWGFTYFFKAHRFFYSEKRYISNLKSLVLLFVNSFLITVVLLLFIIYTLLYLH